MEFKERIYDYGKHNMMYIEANINKADTKAGVALTVSTALLGFFISKIKEAEIEFFGWWLLFTCLGLLLLFGAILCLGLVFWPRYKKDLTLYMSWGGISAFGQNGPFQPIDPNGQVDYWNHLNLPTQKDQFIRDLAYQNYNLAVVCAKKYFWLRCGIVCLGAGTLLCTAVWFFYLPLDPSPLFALFP